MWSLIMWTQLPRTLIWLKACSHRASPSRQRQLQRNVDGRHLWSFSRAQWRTEWVAYPFSRQRSVFTLTWRKVARCEWALNAICRPVDCIPHPHKRLNEPPPSPNNTYLKQPVLSQSMLSDVSLFTILMSFHFEINVIYPGTVFEIWILSVPISNTMQQKHSLQGPWCVEVYI